MKCRLFLLQTVKHMPVLSVFPRHPRRRGDVQKNRQIRLHAACRNAVYLCHHIPKTSAEALIGNAGIGETVRKHRLSCPECRKNFFLNMLCARRRIQQHFRTPRQVPVGRVKNHLSDFFCHRRTARLSGQKDFLPHLCQICLYFLHLCGFAAAIAALQEAGNKASRDMISASYRTHVKINSMCIELIRQFYDETRSFRITGQTPGSYQFIDMNNAGIKEQEVGQTSDGLPLYRKPIFDLKIKAQKKNPFSRMEQNERAKELYGLGFFNPERAQEALGALEMMEFEGIDKVKEQVQNGQTLLNICQQMSQQLDQMALIIQTLTGKDMGIGAAQPTGGGQRGQAAGPAPSSEKDSLASGIMEAQHPMTGYGERLAKRSTPSMGNE